MKKKSAGIVLYRFQKNGLEILLVHPGGPFWVNKDAGVWSIPKGEFGENENPLEAAKREMEEETGIKCSGEFIPLSSVKQKSGKVVYAWALEGDLDAVEIKSNGVEIEWPPKSGIKKIFPEIDKASWFILNDAEKKIIKEQLPFLRELRDRLGLNIY